jgi:hypothetical protein
VSSNFVLGETKTIQWSKEARQRQCNGQKRRDKDNTIVKRGETKTIQWSKEARQRQYNSRKKKDKTTNYNRQNTTQKTENLATGIHPTKMANVDRNTLF